MIAPTPSLRLIYYFPNPFPEVLDLEETVPETHPELDGPIHKGIFSDICLLVSAPIMIDLAQIAWAL
jgi:hypothetical protein